MDSSTHELLAKAQTAESEGKLLIAEGLYRQALAESPLDLQLLSLHGSLAARLGRVPEAIEDFESVLKREPNDFTALRWLSGLYLSADRPEDAAVTCEQTVRLRPGEAEPLNALGICLTHLHRWREAAEAFGKAIKLQPQLAALRFRRASALQALPDYERAAEDLKVGLELDPGNVQARRAQLDCLMSINRNEEGLAAAHALLQLVPGDTQANEVICQALHSLKRLDETQAHLKSWLDEDKQNYRGLVFAGNLSLEEGDFSAAETYFTRAIESDPNQGSAYLGLLQTGSNWSPEDPQVRKMIAISKSDGIDPQELSYLHYALGKTFEDAGEYEPSMRHYDQANRLVLAYLNSSRPFDIQNFERATKQTTGLFTEDFFQKWKHLGVESELPIFVIGMIRSGTTLTEQILASHPDIEGAGEQMFWTDRESIAHRWLERSPTKEEIASVSQDYLSLLHSYGKDATRIVDKMPGNFFQAGLIHSHLPNARFIHVKRDPIDTCLSIWTTQFRIPPPFSGSRKNIVGAYRQYLILMDHWRKVLPPENLLEIEYEHLVADKEATIRKMVAFCGLEWSDLCLRPEERKSRVSTPSLARVRAPIDSTRVQRWKKFEPWLREFKQLA